MLGRVKSRSKHAYFKVYPPQSFDPIDKKLSDKITITTAFILALTSFLGWPNQRYLNTGKKMDLLYSFIGYRPGSERKGASFFFIDCVSRPLLFGTLHLLIMAFTIPMSVLKLATELAPLFILDVLHFKDAFKKYFNYFTTNVKWLMTKKERKKGAKMLFLFFPLFALPISAIAIVAYLWWFAGRAITSPFNAMFFAIDEGEKIGKKLGITNGFLGTLFKMMFPVLSMTCTMAALAFFWPLMFKVTAAALVPSIMPWVLALDPQLFTSMINGGLMLIYGSITWFQFKQEQDPYNKAEGQQKFDLTTKSNQGVRRPVEFYAGVDLGLAKSSVPTKVPTKAMPIQTMPSITPAKTLSR